MKPTKQIALLCCAVLTLSGCGGCQTISNINSLTTASLSSVTSDKLATVSEDVILVTRDAMNTFNTLELRHRAEWSAISKKPNEYAEWLRAKVPLPPLTGDGPTRDYPRGLSYVVLAERAVGAFQTNRTPANEANLRTAIATLLTIKSEIQSQLKTVNAAL